MQSALNTVGHRLRQAIEMRPPRGRERGVRLFCKDIARASDMRAAEGRKRIEGVTPPSVTSYLPIDGNPATKEPDLDFLREAAQLCGVPEAWLICGVGFPTESHRQAADVASATMLSPLVTDRDRAGWLQHAIEVGLGRRNQDEADPRHWRSPNSHHAHWLSSIANLRLRLALSGIYAAFGADDPLGMGNWRRGDPAGTPADEVIEHDIASALVGPIKALKLDASQMSNDTIGDYISAMVPALFILASEAKRQMLEDASSRYPVQEAVEVDEEAEGKPSRALDSRRASGKSRVETAAKKSTGKKSTRKET